MVDASECYGNLRQIFRETLESGLERSRIADDIEVLLSRAYEKEERCVELMSSVLQSRLRC